MGLNFDTNQFRPELRGVVPVSEAAVFAQTPTIQLPAGGDCGAVRAATGNVTDTFGLQCLDQPRFVTVPTVDTRISFNLRQGLYTTVNFLEMTHEENTHSAEVSQFAVVSLPPGEDLPVHGQSHGVAPPGVHGDLFHHVIAECGDLPWDWDGSARKAQA